MEQEHINSYNLDHWRFAAQWGGIELDAFYVGAQIYNLAVQQCERIFLTRVFSKKKKCEDDEFVIECDTYLPLVEIGNLSLNYDRLCDEQIKSLIGADAPIGLQTEGDFSFEFQVWKRK